MKNSRYSYILAMIFVLLTAVFLSAQVSAQEVTITINIVGQGSVDRSQGPPYSLGDKFFLEAKPAAGYQFSGWSDTLGGVSGNTNPIELTVAGNHMITATFTQLAATCFSLSTPVPGGGGTISRNRPGDAECPEGLYLKDSKVLLTAQPNPGYDFTRWKILPEGTQPTTSPVEVVMNLDRTVEAEFNKGCRQLSLSRVPPEGGSPTNVAPLQSSGCQPSFYKVDEPITLTANPVGDYRVAGWTRKIGTVSETIPPAAPPNQNKYSFAMPGLTAQESLSVEVNFKKTATYGFPDSKQTVQENAGAVNVTIAWDKSTLPAAPTLRFKTADGTAKAGEDYVARNVTRTFTLNEEQKTIAVDIIDDKKGDGDKTFFVDLSIEGDASNILLGISRIEITIFDDDTGVPTIRFENPPYQVNESASSVNIPVTVYPIPVGVTEVVVDFYTEDDTATAGQDYEAVRRPLRIPVTSQEARATVNIKIFPDNLHEADEIVRLNLTNPSSSAVLAEDPTVALLTILDDDDPPTVGFSENEYFIKQESRLSASIPVNLSVPSGQDVIIDYTSTLERTGASTEGTLTIASGSAGNALEVDIASAVPGDVFSLQLTNPQNAELGPINAARLYVLDTDIGDCHILTLTFSGYGQAPAATNKASSLGCPAGQYVTGDLIEITAQPDPGWYVIGWQGTIDDDSSSLQNAVAMPGVDLTVTADYRVPIFFSIINSAPEPWSGPDEEEPNNLFSQANGPLQFGREYRGGFPTDGDKEDRFYFRISRKSDVTISLRDIPKGTDYDLFLYPEDWSTGDIASSRNFDNLPEEINITLEPGKYYVRILAGASRSSSEKYRLKVEIN